MKKFAALALSVITLGLSQAASAGYDHSLFARFKEPKNLMCQRSYENGFGYLLNISYSNTRVAKVKMELSDADIAAVKCNAAIIQATEGGNMIYVNLADGTVLPDDGFFVHQPQ